MFSADWDRGRIVTSGLLIESSRRKIFPQGILRQQVYSMTHPNDYRLFA
jgi:hypothetical protein